MLMVVCVPKFWLTPPDTDPTIAPGESWILIWSRPIVVPAGGGVLCSVCSGSSIAVTGRAALRALTQHVTSATMTAHNTIHAEAHPHALQARVGFLLRRV